MSAVQSLFLQQSYEDAWQSYKASITSARAIRWDTVILTASSEDQALAYRRQIRAREERGALPPHTRFAVLPDPGGQRIGSGGATLSALRHIAEENPENPFSGKRVLLIHSGGDSRRVPQYSACGKLFSPVPRLLPDGHRSTLFDEFLIAMAGMAGQLREGMLVLSGDVLLLFNPLQVDFSGEGAAVIAFKEHASTGQNHGVFHADENGDVGEFLHKLPQEVLSARGAVNARGMVDIDTGACLMSVQVMQALYDALIEGSPGLLISGGTRLSFYGDFLYPMASRATEEGYLKEPMEGPLKENVEACRRILWRRLSPFRMRLLRLSPAAFIHFGTSGELRAFASEAPLKYAHLGWQRHVLTNAHQPHFAASGSLIDEGAQIGAGSYIEDCILGEGTRVGAGCLLSGLTLKRGDVPKDVALGVLKLFGGRFNARVYGVMDNPKLTLEEGVTYLGRALSEFMQINRLSPQDLWDGEEHSLWLARLHPVAQAVKDAVGGALNVCRMAEGKGDVRAFLKAERVSLAAGFMGADPEAALDWQAKLRGLVKVQLFLSALEKGAPFAQVSRVFGQEGVLPFQEQMLFAKAAASPLPLRMRIFGALGEIVPGPQGESLRERALAEMREALLGQSSPPSHQSLRIVRPEVSVSLPLRVNFGGGWSDTPPHCLEKGGTVLNAAVRIRGAHPASAQVRRLDELCIELESADTRAKARFSQLAPLLEVSGPFDPFALHKAALMECGVLPAAEGEGLGQILSAMGGGMYLSTQAEGIPKGSGLGTSSILAAACVKAIYAFLGRPIDDNGVCGHVLRIEQRMSTGGGWQDQLGALTPGIKFITSPPGRVQDVRVEPVRISPAALAELNLRYALIYTGQRRLARGLLRDISFRYLAGEESALVPLREMQRLAALMRYELERGDIDEFAQLLNRHWALQKTLDGGSTNTLIERIFDSISHLVCGRMICGAGGGGFLQVILKKEVTHEQVQARLFEVFEDSGVDVWACEIC